MMTGSNDRSDGVPAESDFAAILIDPRLGDAEDDASSPKQKSLLALAGSLLAEISVAKLLLAFTISLLLPAVLLGVAPLVTTAWLAQVSGNTLRTMEVGAVLVLVLVVALGWVGWRPLFRIAEANFWALNALVIQPGYAFSREAIRHLAEQVFGRDSSAIERARLRALSSAGAGIFLCACAVAIVVLVWPLSRWIGSVTDLVSLHHLIVPTLANAIVLISGYLAVAALVWGFADATMDQPTDLAAFDTTAADRSWRIAHLSDIHLVGERYGFRIESGRGGPRGNSRFPQIMACIEAIHDVRPLDLVLVSGDMTDAGRATEWAEFMDALEQFPALAERMLILPGNHDLNIVDRLNPARLDLPFSPGKAAAADADVVGDRGCARQPRARGRSCHGEIRPDTYGSTRAASAVDRRLRRCRKSATGGRPRAPLG